MEVFNDLDWLFSHYTVRTDIYITCITHKWDD